MPTSFASNLDEEFAQVTALCSPRVIAAANGQYVKVVRIKGEFVWHSHAEDDEFFLLRQGKLVIGYRDRADATLGAGNVHVRCGVEHMTAALEECWVVLVEPASTKHTGDREPAITTSIEQQLAHLHAPHQPTRQQETPAQWPSKS
jgi:mannose-6-phosphate isomerase-like protein (cupin superfamily)